MTAEALALLLAGGVVLALGVSVARDWRRSTVDEHGVERVGLRDFLRGEWGGPWRRR